ncbi:MAG: fumarylacetoacetate hydrolase family protein [Nitrospinota bacterium]|nr:fumarylacetoacetate hydrolase family protein [Nitrospinota bacterium]
MKLITFEVKTPVGPFKRLGAVLNNETFLDLNFAMAAKLADENSSRPREMADAIIPSEMTDFAAGGVNSIETAEEVLEFISKKPEIEGPNEEKLIYHPNEIKLLAPIERPPIIRGFAGFERHLKATFEKMGLQIPDTWYERPLCFKSSCAHMASVGDTIPWPSYTEKMDFELEFCAVVGKPGRDISEDKASEHILGYAILNDWSARDAQTGEMAMGTGPYKGKDWCWSFGPWIVTPDELGNPSKIPMAARVNGETWIEATPGEMYWTFEQMLSYTSRDENMLTGDLLGSGTVPGGCGMEIERWIQPGDFVEIDMGPLGVLSNKIGEKGERKPFTYK